MTAKVLVDAGPLVAMRNEREAVHRRCVELLKTLPAPLYTCWPVLTEAVYLLQESGYRNQARELLASTTTGFLGILPLDYGDVPGVNAILEKYDDQRFQLADAALMHLAEREGIGQIFTLDRRDFSVFRLASGRVLTIVGV